MKDVSRKFDTLRTAVAEAVVRMSAATIEAVQQGRAPKGDPLPVAKVAAIQAAKETSRIVPYCHPVPLDFVGVDFTVGEDSITVRVEVKATWKTGVEMEALTGASVAALTVYDMLKMLDEGLVIESVRLVSKRGGKSDYDPPLETVRRAAVLVLSDTVSSGRGEDTSGRLIRDRLALEGFEVADYRVIPDDRDQISRTLIDYADRQRLDLVITTGGTGIGPRDVTPEATGEVLEREITGIAEAARAYGLRKLPFSMLSRGRAGLRGKTLIVNLPGSKGGAADGLDALLPAIKHAFRMLEGERHDQPDTGLTNG
ncbi:MAG: bifunctional molybdenum cofactor biosynthesis protein MoaC/MoaB [Candidatus Glassbacteria bacterium]